MRPIVLMCGLAWAAAAVPAMAQEGDDTRLGGVGRMVCAQLAGARNAPYLGQVGDWALGYMAGRVDAGQTPVDGATLSTADPADVVAGVALRCRQDPDMAVIDAVRSYATEVFGEPARGGPVAADPLPPAAAPPDIPAPDLPADLSGEAIDHAPRPRARPAAGTAEGAGAEAGDDPADGGGGDDGPADTQDDTGPGGTGGAGPSADPGNT